MKIKLINHAGVLIQGKSINLLMDPWTSGSAFNDGWDLISKSCDIDYSKLTHIWISHEHPDHFSISDIKKIIKENNKVSFLFQSTKDKRVINFIKKLGGTIIELQDNEIYKFDTNNFIRIIKCGSLDSLSITHIEDKTIVNMNDCVVGKEIMKLKNAIKNLKIDCLLSQFGYASFISNPENEDKRKQAADKKLTQLKEQILFFQPKFVVPFASFIFFSHEENFYMNDKQNDIESVANFINILGFNPVILYPGDCFSFQTLENNLAIKKYQDDRKLIKPIRSSNIIDFSILQLSSRQYCERVKKFHSIYGIYLLIFLSFIFKFFAKNPFNKIIFKIPDLNKMAIFDIRSGLNDYNGNEKADITLYSEALKYVFDFDWGWKTLTINGRMRIKEEKSLDLGNKVFLAGTLKNIGINIFKDLLILFNRQDRIGELEVIDLFLENNHQLKN